LCLGLDSKKEKVNPVYASAKKFVDSVKKSTTKKLAAVPDEKPQRLNMESFLGNQILLQYFVPHRFEF
jgi:hypothetical protein